LQVAQANDDGSGGRARVRSHYRDSIRLNRPDQPRLAQFMAHQHKIFTETTERTSLVLNRLQPKHLKMDGQNARARL
jgi:hypothetical protein